MMDHNPRSAEISTDSGRRRAGTARRIARLGIVVAGTALVAGACMPQAVTTQGKAIHSLYEVFFGAGVVVAVIVWGLMAWSIVRYRKKSDELPSQVAENGPLEILWTVLPLLTVAGLFVLTLQTLNVVEAKPAPKADPVNLSIVAFQWSWQFSYPAEGVTVTGTIYQPPTVEVPVGVPVSVTLTSRDVDHSFYVPAFLFKRDAIPGFPNHFDFTVQQPGTYAGQCAEFCGTYHADMTFTIKAVSQAEFRSWLAQQQASARTSSGAAGTTALSAPVAPTALINPTSSTAF